MTESIDNNENISLDKETRKVRVLLDPIPTVVQKDEQIKALVAENARKEQLIQSMLIADKAKLEQESKQKEIERAERVNQPLPPPFGGDTCRLDQNENQHTFTVSAEGSYIEPSWVKGHTYEEVIAKVQRLAKVAENAEDFKKIESRLLKKVVKGNKPFDMTFLGNSKEFFKSPLPIGEFDSEEIRQKKTIHNEKLRANRTNWKNNSED